MRLPGTKYQDHLWRYVRSLLIEAALQSLRAEDLATWIASPGMGEEEAWRETFQQRLFVGLAPWNQRDRGRAKGNQQGDSVYELAIELVLAVDSFPQRFTAFRKALIRTHEAKNAFWEFPEREACIGQIIRNFAAEIRDALDHGNYVAATGKRRVPVDFMAQCRMVERIARRVQEDFKHGDLAAMSAILNRKLQTTPIEAGRKNSYGLLRPEWIINWSAAQKPVGPLHTASNKHGNLRFQPEKIREILELLDEGSRLTAMELRDPGDGGTGAALIEAAALGNKAKPGGSAIEKPSAPDDAPGDPAWDGDEEDGDEVVDTSADDVAEEDGVSPRPRNNEVETSEDPATAARSQALIDLVQQCLGKEEEALRVAVWQKHLPLDDWPESCFDAETGEALTVEQLARRYGVSTPTFRKRREAVLAPVKDCINRGLAELSQQDQEE